VSNVQSVIVTLSASYALIGALLLVVLVYARLPWPVKAVAVVVTSASEKFFSVGADGLNPLRVRLPRSFLLPID